MAVRWAGYAVMALLVAVAAEVAGYLYFEVRGNSLSNYRPGWLEKSDHSATLSYYDEPHLRWRTEYLPWGAWHVPDARTTHKSACFDVSYRSNSAGARDRERDRSGSGRFLFLGDSVVEGYGVDEDLRITNQLESLLGAEVLNFSSAEHFGPLNLEILYEQLAQQWEHDHLLVGLLPANDFLDNDAQVWMTTYDIDRSRYRPYYNDVGRVMYVTSPPADGATMKQLIDANDRLTEERLNQAREKKARREQRGVVQHAIDAVKHVSWLPGFVYEVQAIRKRARSYSGYRDFTDLQLRNVLGSLTRISEHAAARGIRVSLVVFPSPSDYLLDPEENRLTARLSRWADAHDVNLLDLLPAFEGRSPMTHSCDSHWSVEGNSFVAGEIAKWLSRYRAASGQ